MAPFRVTMCQWYLLGLALVLTVCRVHAQDDNCEQDGIKARGNKFGEVTVEKSSEACKARCVDTDGCKFWTWYYHSASPNYRKRCSMYGGEIHEKRNNNKAITGSIECKLDELEGPEPEPIVIVEPEPEVLPEPVVEPVVEPASEPELAPADLCATVFAGGAAGEFYAGQSLHLIDGEENAAFPRGITNKVSGVRVAAGCTLTLYQTNDFGGVDMTLTEGESNFRESDNDHSFNDRASSGKCICGVPETAGGACPDGFTTLPDNDHCYAFFVGPKQKKSQPDARAHCAQFGADLVAFETEEEFNQVISWMKDDEGQSGFWFWTALEKLHATWTWAGCPASYARYTSLAYQPGTSDCGYLILDTELIDAKLSDCNQKRPWICEHTSPRCEHAPQNVCATVFGGDLDEGEYGSHEISDGEEKSLTISGNSADGPYGLQDAVSSARVESGCILTLYSSEEFSGKELVLTAGSHGTDPAFTAGFNDKALSATCRCE